MALRSRKRAGIAWVLAAALLQCVLGAVACGRPEPAATRPTERPSILLVTLDTTRADAIGPEASAVDTPAFNALAARGLRFKQAYATVPETLPSHGSIMTGLYPAGHGIHENARYLRGEQPVLAARVQQAGYRTAAFVSSFVLARRFGLTRGFDLYDDTLPSGRAERSSVETTDAAVTYLGQPARQPVFLWVHYFDPHTPYAPEEPFRSRYAANPYLGEIAAMDRQLGRIVEAFERHASGPTAIVVVSDHGEGLGDHGEVQHGHLLYQSTMHVPLVLVGPRVRVGTHDRPVSIRRVYHTVLDWAGVDAEGSLFSDSPDEIVLGEAMKPFLSYGWQPQIMAVAGRFKAISAGTVEAYDLAADPAEARNLGSGANLPAGVRKTLDDYPVPSLEHARAPDTLTEEARRNLASLGYVSSGATPVLRKGAPRPAEMVHLLDTIEEASNLFVQERYREAIPLLHKILAGDPGNLDAILRLATSHSALGENERAEAAFRKAAALAPDSEDVRTYAALHYARGKDWPRAVPLLERIVADSPDRLPAVEALAVIRERQGRLKEAIQVRQQIYRVREPTAAESVQLGRLAMAVQDTGVAIESFERARRGQGPAFSHDLELGVLYLAARRLIESRDALDRVPSSHEEYPMALFKRAQVSVLLKEPDRAARIELATRHADATTRKLIANERLFQEDGVR